MSFKNLFKIIILIFGFLAKTHCQCEVNFFEKNLKCEKIKFLLNATEKSAYGEG